MQEFSKYKVITFGLVLMFVFVIAAIYANTKDIALQKSKTMQDSSQQQINSTSTDTQAQIETELSDNTPAVVTENNNDLGNKILNLTERIDNIERTVFAPKNDNADSGVRCSVKGIINDGHFMPMSDSDALRESRENNKEVLITCIFK